MMRRCVIALVAWAAAAAAGSHPASAERLVTSISRHQVMVSSSFTGTSIVLFGTIEPDTPTARRRATSYNLVTTISGPKETSVTRRKERVLGIWTNADSRAFLNVPGYLAVLTNRPIAEISNVETLRRLQIGFDNIVLPQQIGSDVGDVAADDPFRTNFIRLKKAKGLYVEETNGVTFLTPTVFRAGIPLPAGAPVGNYDVSVRVFADGALVAQTSSAFEIVKVGFEQFVAGAARDYGLLYGIATAMMAIFTGWLASVVFRRD
jgi:uncharacterized protein (TIGR02186 family)